MADYKAGSFWNNLQLTADSFAGSALNNAAPAAEQLPDSPLKWILNNWQVAAVAAVALLVWLKD